MPLVIAALAVSSVIKASLEKDPGCTDVFGNFYEEMLKHGAEPMSNAEYTGNHGEIPQYFEDHPPPEELAEYSAFWKLEHQNRTFALIVEDMEKDYLAYVDFVLPNAEKILTAFRKSGQPVVWTNWNRLADDGAYGAIDRFYGPQGWKGEGHYENPMWIDTVSEPDGVSTVLELAPKTEDERSLVIKSLHLSKFSDRYPDGTDILAPMLNAWGVNTVVIIGAWTEDCITATAFEGSDRYGFDIVIIPDALATATPSHTKAIDVMASACAKKVTTDQMIAYLETHSDKIMPPKAGLSYTAVSTAASVVTEPAAVPPPGVGVPLSLVVVIAVVSSIVSVVLTKATIVRKIDVLSLA